MDFISLKRTIDMINKFVSFISVSMMAATIAACGGGGSSGGDTSPLPIVGTESGEPSQSLPVATIPTPIPPAESTVGLDRLLGLVTLTYQFTGSETVFTTQTVFSNSSFSVTDGGRTVLESFDTDRGIACATFDGAAPTEYFCVLIRATDGSGQVTSQNFFIFDLTSATRGGGVFEFCSGEALIGDACVVDLLANPDGPLAVGVSQQFAKSTGGSRVDGLGVTDADFDIFLGAAEAEFGNTGYKASSPMVGSDELFQTYKALLDHMQ